MSVVAAFEWSVIWDSRGPLWDGFKQTMKAGVVGIVASYGIGLVLGAVRAHRIPLLSQLAAVYVEVIRNTPILVQMFFLYFGLPALGIQTRAVHPRLGLAHNLGRRVYDRELPRGLRSCAGPPARGGPRARFRAGEEIPERDAADRRADRAAVVDQHLHLGSQEHVVALLVRYAELTYVANNIQSNTFLAFEMFTALAVAYLVIVWMLSALIRFLERRLALPEAF